MVDILSLSQTGSSVGTSKVKTLQSAKNRMVLKLQQQIKHWNNNKGADLPKDRKSMPEGYSGDTQRALWFKQMDMSDNWMLQLRMGQTVVYKDEEAEKADNSWFHPIPEDQMVSSIEGLIKKIQSGEADDMLEYTFNKMLDAIAKAKEKREAKKNAP